MLISDLVRLEGVCSYRSSHVQINKRNLRSHSKKLIFCVVEDFGIFHGIFEIFLRTCWCIAWERKGQVYLHGRTVMRFSRAPLDTASLTCACPGTAVPCDRCTGSPTARRSSGSASTGARSRGAKSAKLGISDFLHKREVGGRDERCNFVLTCKEWD